MPKEYLDEPIELLNRSREHYRHGHKDTFNAGECVPIWAQPVIAGETYQISVSALVRTLPLVTCPMDDAHFSIWFFWVPFRILYNKFKNLRGELEDYWTGTEQAYYMPEISWPSGGFSENSVADHLGIPTKVAPTGVPLSAAYFRAYASIWNEWFRDQYLMPKIYFPVDGSTVAGAQTGGDFIQTASRGGDLAPLCRPHDLFGSALPFAQKGPPEGLPIGGFAPVISRNTTTINTGDAGLRWYIPDGSSTPPAWDIMSGTLNVSGVGVGVAAPVSLPSGAVDKIQPANLYAVLNSQTANINDLRLTLAIQHLKEREALSGSRYREILRSMYGVENPDPLMDIPTYLGGFSQPIEFQPVVQSSETATSPQGNVAGYSSTGVVDNGFVHQALEDGLIMACCGVRNSKSYQQGLDRMFTIVDELDFWNPMFNGLGQMSVKNYEIYLQNGNAAVNNQVFGYQDAWYFWHNRPNVVAGQMRSNATNSLDKWHFADDYQSLPRLGRQWMTDNSADNINRVLAAQSPSYPQFFCDIVFEGSVTSAMPAHAEPGLDRV